MKRQHEFQYHLGPVLRKFSQDFGVCIKCNLSSVYVSHFGVDCHQQNSLKEKNMKPPAKIVAAIKHRLHEYGFEGVPQAQSMLIGLANDVKKIVKADIRDNLMADYTTGAGDYADAEEYADRIIEGV